MQNLQIENNSTVSFRKKTKLSESFAFCITNTTRTCKFTANKNCSKAGFNSNYNKSLTGDIVLDNQTKLTPVGQVPFNYSETLTTTGVVPISSFPRVAAEQLVTVKAEVTHVSGEKKKKELYAREC